MDGSMVTATKRFLVTGVLWSGGGRLVAMLGNLVLSMILARALSPADYGRFYVVLSSVVIFAVIAGLGVDRGVVRAVARVVIDVNTPSAIQRVFRYCFGWAVLGAAGLALLAAALAWQLSLLSVFGTGVVFALAIAWMFTGTLQMQLAESFRALGHIHLANVFGGVRSSGILSALLPCIVVLVLWKLGWLNLEWAIGVMLLAACVIVGGAFFKLRSLLARLPEPSAKIGPPDSLRPTDMLLIGFPLWLASVVTVLHSQGLLWIASAMEPANEVARIAAAQRVVLVLIAPTAIVNAVLPPLIARLWEQNQIQKLQRVTQLVAAAATIPSLIVFASLAVGGPALLSWLFGEFYKTAYVPMLLMSSAQVVNIATGAWQEVLAMSGQGKLLFRVTTFGLLIFVLLSAVITSMFPGFGVAFAWAIGTIVANITGLWMTWRKTGMLSFAWVRRDDFLGLIKGSFLLRAG